MFGRIARFELGYQLRNPVFWVVAVLFFLLTYGSMVTPNIQIGAGGNIHKNSPVALAQVTLIMSIFFMFVTTAFVSNVIVRDDESGFGPMVRTTRVSRFDYLIGRFLGAYLAGALAFLVVPLGVLIGTVMPWVDPETLGPNGPGAYLYAYVVLALPNLLVTAAIFFAVATVTRSMMGSYVGVVIFLVAYFVLNGVVRAKPDLRETLAYVEPFGIAAFSNVTRYWTASESNAHMPVVTGALLVNRLIWIGFAFAALAFAYGRFRFAERGISPRRMRREQAREAKLAETPPHLVDRLPPVRGDAAAGARFWARTRFEMALVFRSPAFFVLMLVGLANAIGGLLYANEIYGTAARPLTFAVLQTVAGAFGIIPIIIAIYYGGEVVWRDRERKMHEIVDATALPNWAYMAPKSLAVAGVLFATLVVSMVAAIIVQLVRGVDDVHVGQYIGWYLAPTTVDMVLLAILSVFVQALSPNKYVGWGIMVVYLVATITLSVIGFDHPLYLYGSTGRLQLSDMNGSQVGGPAGWWLRVYWGAIALVLAVLAHLLWRRGTETRLMPRLKRLPHRLRGGPGAVLAAALIIAIISGGLIYRQMDVLNVYRSNTDIDARQAVYEKRFLRFAAMKQPSLTDVNMTVAIYPHQRRLVTTGSYRFINDTGAPLRRLIVRLPFPDTKLQTVAIPGATLVSNDPEYQFRIYRFSAALAPGGAGTLSFRTLREQRGIRANDDDTRLVENGTFLQNAEFAPQIGMNRNELLSDPEKRRKYGLPAELRMPKLEDTAAQARNYIGDADWVHSDITLSTSADEVPIAPGRKISDVVADGRRTARFVSEAPILAFFSIQSAGYAVKSETANGVKLSVYFDPKHGFNVDRMLAAMRMSLAYYRQAFGPYQFDYLRIIEFPGYQSYAQSFAGTVPYSERIGFIADVRNPHKIDYVTYVTAHEIAHQYWAHQLIGADMQGGTMLSETMAQYSALMVMKHLYGEDKIRRFLKYELDSYLRARGGERIEELPLDRVENQPYIHYRKGAVVMYLLQDRLGEARVNAMLRGLLDRYRFKSQPYARSTELVNGLLSLARTPQERQLVLDLTDRITIYDLKTRSAVTRRLPNGTWQTTLTINAAKAYADGKGVEKPAPLNDQIDIGVFTGRPGIGAFSANDVLEMRREPIRSGSQVVRIITQAKPTFAGVDPYNKYIDRNSDDNLVAVT